MLIPYVYVSIESIYCFLLSSFELKVLLLTFTGKNVSYLTFKSSLCFWYWFIVSYKFFMNFLKTIYVYFTFYCINYFILKVSCFLAAFIIFKLDCCHLLSNYKFLYLIRQNLLWFFDLIHLSLIQLLFFVFSFRQCSI